MPTYGAPSVQFVRGEGTELWDRDGKEYLDFLAGLAVIGLGHAHPEIADAIAEQARPCSTSPTSSAPSPAPRWP